MQHASNQNSKAKVMQTCARNARSETSHLYLLRATIYPGAGMNDK